MDTLEPSFCLDQDSSGEWTLPAGTPAARTLSRYGMRPDWLAEEERARERADAHALFAGQGFTDVAQSPIRPDQLSQPDSSAFGTVSSSIGTNDTFLSAGQIGSGNILDINFDMLNSGLEARNPVAKAGFYDVFCEFLMKFCPDFATNSRKE